MCSSDLRQPVEDLQKLRREIDLFDSRLSARPWYVIANKMDLPDAAKNLDLLKARFPALKVVPVSAADATGIAELKGRLADWLEPAETALEQHALAGSSGSEYH